MSCVLDGVAQWPSVDYAKFGEVETRPLSKVQSFVAANLARNWVAIPHVTHHYDADITELEISRKRFNESASTKITPVALLVKALAMALQEFPQFNASYDPSNGSLVYKKYYNIGVAVETTGGLLVPVIRDCASRALEDIAAEIASVSERARSKGLSMSEMSGGCITLTSLGHIGGTYFTPIINAPEVAILGVARARQVPARGAHGDLVWQTALPLSLSYDHRVVNGADAARFCRFIDEQLAGPQLLV